MFNSAGTRRFICLTFPTNGLKCKALSHHCPLPPFFPPFFNENVKVWLNSDVFPSETRLPGWQSSAPGTLLLPPTLPHAWDDIIFHM